MITVDCYNCKSSAHTHYCDENGFSLVRCDGCGLLYIRERPEDAQIDEATAVGQHHGDKTLDANVHYNPSIKTEYRGALKSLFNGDFSGIETWLDVGCGYGEFLETISEASGGKVSVFGSEPNQVKQAHDKKRGLNVDYFDLTTHDRKYDMVSLMNVYSHLSDPNAFIGDMKNVVKPGGRLLIETGDAAGFSYEDILKPLCLPDHLSFASEKILTDMLTRHGFTVEKTYRCADLPLRPLPFLKEVVKAVLPGYDSFLKYYLKWWKYQDSRLYILARL